MTQKKELYLFEMDQRFMNIRKWNGEHVREFQALDFGLEKEQERPYLKGVDAEGRELVILMDDVEEIFFLDTPEQGRLARLQQNGPSDIEEMKAILPSMPASTQEVIQKLIDEETGIQKAIDELIADGVKPYQRKGGGS